MSMGVKIAPSIAAADQGRLAQEAAHLKEWGADWIHVDIMDGNFAPNLTFGPSIVKAIRKASDLPLDCHLMISNPEILLERFLQAGGNIMTIHAETVNPESLPRIEKKIREYKAKLGVAFKPATSLDSLDLSGCQVSLITIMTVNPGFSGQKFMPEVLPKLDEANRRFPDRFQTEIEVDGGVDQSNAKLISERGASVLVAGNAVFGQRDPMAALSELKKLVAS
jgi:ribulose-phosphate 3-epimerase